MCSDLTTGVLFRRIKVKEQSQRTRRDTPGLGHDVEYNTPIIIAHRGLHALHPENSVPAFRAAARSGIDWIELDVQQSIDGFPIILHDETLERTTGMVGRVDRLRATELERLRLRDDDARPIDAH